MEYSGYGLWTQQISDFIREVIGKDAADEKVVLVGNSLGGYNALATAAKTPELVRCGGVVRELGGVSMVGRSVGSNPAGRSLCKGCWEGA